MRLQSDLRHEFVEFIPRTLEPGTLYISLEYNTASHLCCCGCGLEVVTPLNPAKWRLVEHGATVSLHPSIGNWSFPCQSHYWVDRGRVRWAEQWTKRQVDAGRDRDRRASERLAANKMDDRRWSPLVWLRSLWTWIQKRKE